MARGIDMAPRQRTNRSAPIPNEGQRWAAILARDKSFDGTFVFSVATTGVYCRPSCPSRRAKRENVAFYADPAAAEAAGFRACKRCRPDGASLDSERARLVAEACREIENNGLQRLDDLSAKSGLSRFHFHRIFKAITGVTPKEYSLAHRRKAVRTALKSGTAVTDAIYDAGFQSSSRFYEKVTDTLGMTPKAFRAGGANEVLNFAVSACSLGRLLVAASDKGIAAILIGDEDDLLIADLRKIFPKADCVPGDGSFASTIGHVVEIVERSGIAPELPLDVRGTAFQQRVWKALKAIPPGSTATYSEIATRIGHPKAVRAVARACATNPLAVVVPCHRVVRGDGHMAGYRWGIERKRALIAREAGIVKRPNRQK